MTRIGLVPEVLAVLHTEFGDVLDGRTITKEEAHRLQDEFINLCLKVAKEGQQAGGKAKAVGAGD